MAAYRIFKSYFKETSYHGGCLGWSASWCSEVTYSWAQVASERKMLWNFCKTSRERCHRKQTKSKGLPWKMNMLNPKNIKWTFGRWFWFTIGWSLGSILIFEGVRTWMIWTSSNLSSSEWNAMEDFGSIPLEWNYRKVSTATCFGFFWEHWRSRVVCVSIKCVTGVVWMS